jgi:hypothetical protein
LVGLVEEHLADLQARVDISRNTSDGHEASRLPLLEVWRLLVVVFMAVFMIEFQILGERLGSGVGESRRSKRQ